MDISDTTLFRMMGQRMAYHSERQSVLAGNIANANTPDYRPLEVKQPDFGKMVEKQSNAVNMMATHPSHIQLGTNNPRFKHIEQKNTYETTPVGNEVVLEEQMLKMSENTMDYQTTTSLYRKMIDIMRVATGGNR